MENELLSCREKQAGGLNDGFQEILTFFILRRVVAERIRAPESSSGVSDQQSVCSGLGHDTCVFFSTTFALSFG